MSFIQIYRKVCEDMYIETEMFITDRLICSAYDLIYITGLFNTSTWT